MPDTTVQLPDGRTLLIPDGTSPDQMAQVRNKLARTYANPKTGVGMEEAAGAKEQERVGQPLIQAADKHAENQAKYAERMNRFSRSPTPFTNAISAMDPIGTARVLAGSKIGSYLGEKAAPMISNSPEAKEYGEAFGGLLGGLGSGLGHGYVKGAARKVLLDPVTGKPTVTPTSIAERVLRTPEEASAATLARAPSEPISHSPNLANQRFLAEQGKAVPISESPNRASANYLEEQNSNFAKRLGAEETARQKELAANERFKQQHASSLNARGPELGDAENPGWHSNLSNEMPESRIGAPTVGEGEFLGQPTSTRKGSNIFSKAILTPEEAAQETQLYNSNKVAAHKRGMAYAGGFRPGSLQPLPPGRATPFEAAPPRATVKFDEWGRPIPAPEEQSAFMQHFWPEYEKAGLKNPKEK